MPKNSFGLIGWLGIVLAVVALGTFPEPGSGGPFYSVLGRIVDIASDQSTVRIAVIAAPSGTKTTKTNQSDQRTKQFTVPANKDLRTTLKSLRRGDLVTYTTEPEPEPETGKGKEKAKEKAKGIETLKELLVEAPEIPIWQRLVTVIGAALLVWLFALAVLGKGGIAKLILGADGLYSKSKFQLVVWFGALMVVYLSALWLRFCYSCNWLIGTVNIPSNLLLLSGLSALSFAGAKAITQTKQDKVDAAVAKGVPGAGDLKKQKAPNRVANLVYDLVHDDGDFVDLGDFQMVLITLVAAVTYLVQVFMYLRVLDLSATVTLPDVDGTLLAAFGLGQGAYLMKKAASGSNPDPNPAQPAPAGGAGGGGAGAGAPPVPPVPPAPANAAGVVEPQAAGKTRVGVEA